MRLFKFLRRHPLAILGALALGFVAWLWRDAFDQQGWRDPEVANFVIVSGPPAPPQLPAPPPGPVDFGQPTEALRPNPRGTAQGLSKLKPGMTRAEVEVLVGAPAPDHIHPATVADGQVTYSTSYEADLGPAPTVRPIRTHRPVAVPESKSLKLWVVTLQFDATKPGHPLVGIYYPDPLF